MADVVSRQRERERERGKYAGRNLEEAKLQTGISIIKAFLCQFNFHPLRKQIDMQKQS